MAEIIDDIAYLTQEIGPHPAGTEEEQRAALYLADQMQKEAGFATVVEDFQCVTNDQLPNVICFGVALLGAVLSIVVPSLGILWLLLTVGAAVLYGMEITGRPVLSRLFRTGASQNVVAKYQPTPANGANARRRKVILVANYDSGKVLTEEKPPFAAALPILQKASAIALVVSAFVLLLRSTLFAADTGAMSSILTFLLVICAVLFAIPLVRSVLHIVAPFNQSANNNASGVSVLLDVARKVGNGLVSQEEALERSAEEGNRVHGEEAARAAGVVPEGASLEYEAEMSPQESLAAAKAAIAALTGKPVADKVPVTDISSRLVKGGGLIAEDEDEVSSVRFEVGKRPEPAPSPLARTMVSATLDEETKKEPDSGEKDEVIIPKQQIARKQAAEAAAAAAAAAAKEATLSATPEPVARVQTSDTPSWAKIAQEKARANKPDAGKTPKVNRSRYADTVAARMMEHHASNPYGSPVAIPVSEPEVAQSELSSKVRALQNEIESFSAPRADHEGNSAHFVETAANSQSAALSAEDLAAEQEWHLNNTAAAPVERKPAPKPIASPAPWLDRDPEPTVTAEVQPASIEMAEHEAVANDVPAPVSHETLYEAAIEEVDQLAEKAHVEPEPVVESEKQIVEEPVQGYEHSDSHEQSKPSPRPSVRHSQRLHRSVPGNNEVEEIEEELDSATSPMDPVDGYANIPEDYPANEEASRPAVSSKKSVHSRHSGSLGDFFNNAVHSGSEKASQMQHSFASRLKSITSRKQSFEEEYPAEEYLDEQPYNEDYYEESAVSENEEVYVDNRADQPEQTASPSVTTSISPIDVSQFMDNEEFDDEEEPIRRIDDSVANVDSFHGGDGESTARIPAARVQEEMKSYSYDYSDEMQGERYTEEPLERTAPQPVVASPIVGMEEMVSPVSPAVEQADHSRQVIVLPDVTPARSASGENLRQRAPMAEVNEDTSAGSKSLLSNMLPRIDGNTGAFSTAPAARSLNLPSFDTGAQSAVSTTGSFSTVGGTGSFAPVGDELVSDVAPEERYIDDADDSAYDEEYTETGAFAGPG